MKNIKKFQLATSDDHYLQFSIHGEGETALLFIHNDFLSSQLPLNGIGVEILHQGENIKLGLMNPPSHQSWFIDPKEFDALVAYFRGLRFPVPRPDPFNYSKPHTGIPH